MEKVTDQLHRVLELQKTPERIISLVPSQTELLVDLGLEENLVGITKFCVHPEHLRGRKRIVGGTKKVHFDRIRTLEPDLILCNKEENTREMVEVLEKIAPVHVSDVKDVSGVLELIGQYGKIFRIDETAGRMAEKIKDSLGDFQKAVVSRPVRRAAYLIWREPWMAVGRDTFIDHLMELNHLENVFREKDSRYPEIDLAELGDGKVDVILLSSEPYPFGEAHKEELQQFVEKNRIHLVDGEFFSWYGSRLVRAFDYFKGIQL